MRLDEPVARGRARRPRSRTARSAAWCRSTTSPTGRRAPLADGEVIDLGGKRVRHLDTPHVPHGWEARRALRGDHGHAVVRRPLHARRQRARARRPTTSSGPRSRPRTMFRATCLTPETAPTIRAARRPRARTRWRSCTARRSTATAPRRSTTSRTSTSRSTSQGREPAVNHRYPGRAPIGTRSARK